MADDVDLADRSRASSSRRAGRAVVKDLPTVYTRHATVSTEEIDEVIIVATDDAVCGIYYPHHWTKPDRATFGVAVNLESDPVLSGAAAQLQEYLRGERTTFDFLTSAHGSPFEERVWSLLRAVPYGWTVTYGELAEQLGNRGLARMVGRAVGHNPLSVVVGCHRVVGTNGKVTGYAGGLERKLFLLALEKSVSRQEALPEAPVDPARGAG